jgi:copper chaperone
VKIVALATALLLLASGAQAGDPKPTSQAVATTEVTAVIPVKGMHCGGCVSHVDQSLKKVAGVKSVTTDLEKAQTTVVFDPAKVKPEQIVAAIAETGYEPGTPVLK